jgi:hypothetical protein
MSTTTFRDGRVLFSSYRPESRSYAWRLLASEMVRPGSYAYYADVGTGVYYPPLWRGDPDGDLTDAMRDATTAELIPAWCRGSAERREHFTGWHGPNYPGPFVDPWADDQ